MGERRTGRRRKARDPLRPDLRGDSQNHAEYASRLFDWDLSEFPLTASPDFDHAWDFDRSIGDYFHPIDRGGRRSRGRPRGRSVARVEE